jgi:proline iminopeptidase
MFVSIVARFLQRTSVVPAGTPHFFHGIYDILQPAKARQFEGKRDYWKGQMIMRITTVLSMLVLMVSVSCSDSPTIEEGYLDVNGTSLFYKTMGSGDPIVVLHGGPGFDHRQFLPFIWELAARHKVILYDQRGTGLSSGPVDSTSISIDTFIADIEGIREAFGIEQMNLLGHSWGGILAMHYGIRHQDKLKSLILCSTAASDESFAEMRATYEANRLPEDAELLEEIYLSDEYQNQDPQAIERFWRVYFKPYFSDQSLASELDLLFTENTIKHGNVVAGYLFQSIGAFDLHEDLKVIKCPTLVIHGDADPMPVKYAERIHESIEGSELVIAEDSGHWLFVDATETFRSSILDFLAAVDGR